MTLTTEQLAERRMGLGASDAAAAVGLSPWRTPYQLWREKLGEAEDAPDDDEEPLRFAMGKALEPVALEHFTRKTKLQVSDQQRKFIDPKWPRRWVSVDALSSDGGLVEAKSTGFASPAEWGDEFEDAAIPQHYLMQVMHGLACSELTHCWVPLIVSNRQFKLYRVKRDEDLIQLLTEREKAFWAMVEAREPPAPVSLEDVKLRWPAGRPGSKILATEDIAHAVTEHAMAKRVVKEAEARVKEWELLIKQAMGEVSELVDVSAQPLVSWKTNKPSMKFDVALFADDHPNLYGQYLREKSGARVFLNKLK